MRKGAQAGAQDHGAGRPVPGLRLQEGDGSSAFVIGSRVLINWPLQRFGLSLEQISSWIFSPLAFIMGVAWEEANRVGSLFDQKLVLDRVGRLSEAGRPAEERPGAFGALGAHRHLRPLRVRCSGAGPEPGDDMY